MNVQDIPRNGDDYASVALIDAATALLTSRNRDIPDDFLAKLFGLAVPDDLARYTAEQLAGIAEQSWSFLAERPAGAPKLRFEPAAAPAGISVLEIINDDMPFLVDSVVTELNRRGLDIRLFVHPVFVVERDLAGKLVNFKGARTVGGHRESFIHIHVDGADDAAQRTDLVRELESILADVRVSVQDWKSMLSRISGIIADLQTTPSPLPVEEIAEAVQFMEWIADDNFTLLGARDYSFTENADVLEPSFETGLGLLRSRDVRLLQRWNQPLTITPEIRTFLEQPKLLIVTKATIRSRIHRRVYLDYIGIKRFDRDGKLIGERRFCGLFTSTAYTRAARTIPFLRRKIDGVIRRAGFDPSSHSGKALVNVLETYPRDDLFQIDEDLLYQFALTILQLDERPRVRVLPRRDRFDRFVSVVVYVPRDRYDSKVRAAIGNYLASAFNGRVSAYHPFFPEGPLVRVHFIIGRNEGAAPDPDRAALDRAVAEIVRNWVDGLCETLTAGPNPARGQGLLARYRDAFPIDYREIYPPATALTDIEVIEMLAPERPLGVQLYREEICGQQSAGLKVFSRNRPIPLSERVPVLENMGFRVVDERTYHIEPKDSEQVWFHDMTLESALGQDFDLAALKDRLEACFLVVMGKKAESDGYNALVLASGLGWRDVALIRTISRFLRQVRVPFSQDYMWTTLRKYSGLTAQIVELFRTRFDPRLTISPDERGAREAAISASVETALQAVES